MWPEQRGGCRGEGSKGCWERFCFQKKTLEQWPSPAVLVIAPLFRFFFVVICFGFWGTGERVAIRVRGDFS